MARYSNKVDAKGRVTVPARLRNNLSGLLYVTNGLDENFLAAYTPERFDALRKQFEEQNSIDPAIREIIRYFIGEAIPCEMDAQGRISISDELWSEIDVKAGDEIYFIDMFDKVEICKKSFYDARRQKGSRLADLDLSLINVKGL